jgi:hypothetical protein
VHRCVGHKFVFPFLATQQGAALSVCETSFLVTVPAIELVGLMSFVAFPAFDLSLMTGMGVGIELSGSFGDGGVRGVALQALRLGDWFLLPFAVTMLTGQTPRQVAVRGKFAFCFCLGARSSP